MENAIENLLSKRHPLMIVYFKDGLNLKVEKKQSDLASEFHNFYYIGANSSLLPFLTVRENLLLGIARKDKKAYLQEIIKWGNYFKLAEAITHQKATAISSETRLLIHLIRGLALHREIIFLNELELDLSLEFTLSLIPSLKKIAKESSTAFIILTAQAELKDQEGTILIDVQQQENRDGKS
ncbi:hypothetical protein [Vagococcus salmoninarum]|uniref:hypothetical protein n=1 Tax=Vagococcus salmoninarum TaxID=2739 RepID=UPI0018816F48|nr:hypothetical protein [Vagococcus salmoninarum]MBE9390156.1 hypothetical protein [Vagococcus salmoninarum]